LDFIGSQIEQAIDDRVDLSFGHPDFGGQPAALLGVLREVGLPFVTLFYRDVGVKGTLNLGAKPLEIQLPPILDPG
jgi:hypothetical protein